MIVSSPWPDPTRSQPLQAQSDGAEHKIGMKITRRKLQNVRHNGILPNKGGVLGVGSSNLYSAEVGYLHQFAKSFDADIAKRSPAGRHMELVSPRTRAFELLERVGLGYHAIHRDITQLLSNG
jgi:hypothetical protein